MLIPQAPLFLIRAIMEINEEAMGFKAVVKRRRGSVKKVEVGSNEVLIDIDDEESLGISIELGKPI